MLYHYTIQLYRWNITVPSPRAKPEIEDGLYSIIPGCRGLTIFYHSFFNTVTISNSKQYIGTKRPGCLSLYAALAPTPTDTLLSSTYAGPSNWAVQLSRKARKCAADLVMLVKLSR